MVLFSTASMITQENALKECRRKFTTLAAVNKKSFRPQMINGITLVLEVQAAGRRRVRRSNRNQHCRFSQSSRHPLNSIERARRRQRAASDEGERASPEVIDGGIDGQQRSILPGIAASFPFTTPWTTERTDQSGVWEAARPVRKIQSSSCLFVLSTRYRMLPFPLKYHS